MVLTVVLLVVIAALIAGAFVAECAACRREGRDRQSNRMDASTAA